MKKTMKVGLALAVVAASWACNFDVTNPGPVQQEFLADPDAQPAVVAGAGRALAHGLNWISYTSAAVAREIHPSGSTGSFGISQQWQNGELSSDDPDLNTHWSEAQRARWLAEEAIRIIDENGEAEPGLRAQANLWVGYANRLLGENMCRATIDGSAPQASTVFLDRAEAAFTAAASAGSGAVATAAVAGRASVRAQKGDWAGAVADAAQVADGFSYKMPYYAGFGDDQQNRIFRAMAGNPYRAHSQWSTWVEDYGLSAKNPSGDPRVAYTYQPGQKGDAATECCGSTEFYPQQKFKDGAAAIELSSGAEMRLIEAEKLLMDGNFSGAMDRINGLRTAAGMPAETAGSVAEAWGFLKRENAIEMWLEGRRLAALRRWHDAGLTEADLDPLEQVSGDISSGSHLLQRDYCFPISLGEQQTNTNVGVGG
ncbi:MAG: RagB/SusD family nutrient uptake outer membrane protein [Gemmatimonadota bacterium]